MDLGENEDSARSAVAVIGQPLSTLGEGMVVI